MSCNQDFTDSDVKTLFGSFYGKKICLIGNSTKSLYFSEMHVDILNIDVNIVIQISNSHFYPITIPD